MRKYASRDVEYSERIGGIGNNRGEEEEKVEIFVGLAIERGGGQSSKYMSKQVCICLS